ncbi:MAG: cistern family PEP-CTERM protein [Thainema sp.]
MNRTFLTGTLVAGALATASVVFAEPASAFTWDWRDPSWAELTADHVGTSFDVFFYESTINGTSVEGLNATANFALKAFVAAQDGQRDYIDFDITLTNWSNSDIWDSARLSGLAFAIDPDAVAATSNGTFDNAIINGNYPEGYRTVDVCYTDGNACPGGRNGGVSLGDTGSFYTRIFFDDGALGESVRVRMDQFLVRWQSLTSNADGRYGDTYKGASGVGTGQVPTPALIPSILGAGIAAFRKKRQEKKLQEQV